MEKSFAIEFDFPLERSAQTLRMKALARLHHSTPYYVVQSFHLADSKPGGLPVLPPVEIELADQAGTKVWVHRNSGRSSLLSLVLGKAIEESGNLQ